MAAKGRNVIAGLVFQIETTSSQKLTALREACAAYLSEDPDCTVIGAQSSQATHIYEVSGVETQSKKVFREETEATDTSKAEAQVVGESKTKVVVTVIER